MWDCGTDVAAHNLNRIAFGPKTHATQECRVNGNGKTSPRESPRLT